MPLLKFYFITHKDTRLSDLQTGRLDRLKNHLLSNNLCVESNSAESADALILQEECSYKDQNYIQAIQSDAFVKRYFDKLYTVNVDDGAVGFFKGIYNNICRRSFDPSKHHIVPPLDMINQLVFQKTHPVVEPLFLAGWRGNTVSNKIRVNLTKQLLGKSGFLIESSQSWFNHPETEKQSYIDLILNCKFSLCPAGWGPSSFRIFESMALGRSPVIIADQFMPAKGPQWSEFALFIPEKSIDRIPEILLAHESEALAMGQKAKLAWDQYFSEEKLLDYCAKALLQSISASKISELDKELVYWNSFWFHFQNKWTLPQRMFNKLKKLFHI